MSLRRKASKDADWKHTGWIIMHTHTHTITDTNRQVNKKGETLEPIPKTLPAHYHLSAVSLQIM